MSPSNAGIVPARLTGALPRHPALLIQRIRQGGYFIRCHEMPQVLYRGIPHYLFTEYDEVDIPYHVMRCHHLTIPRPQHPALSMQRMRHGGYSIPCLTMPPAPLQAVEIFERHFCMHLHCCWMVVRLDTARCACLDSCQVSPWFCLWLLRWQDGFVAVHLLVIIRSFSLSRFVLKKYLKTQVGAPVSTFFCEPMTHMVCLLRS